MPQRALQVIILMILMVLNTFRSDHADPAVRSIKLEDAELRRKNQEMLIQMNFVLSFLDIKDVITDAKNTHTVSK